MHIVIDIGSDVPIYRQIAFSITRSIELKELSKGDRLPSINAVANQYNLSKDTVIKGFKLLQQKGIIASVHGKGFFIHTEKPDLSLNVMLMLDTFTNYKQDIYHAMLEAFGKKAKVDTYFHHYNFKVFEKLILDNIGNFDYYIIIPPEDSRLEKVINKLPSQQIYLMDRISNLNPEKYAGIYQDFASNLREILANIKDRIRQYKKFILLFRNTITIPPVELKEEFKRSCEKMNVNYQIIEDQSDFEVVAGDAFLVIDDQDLVNIVRQAWQKNLIPGENIGILSYNETSLKQVVASGISVISTDFVAMGKTIVKMVLNDDHYLKANRCLFIDRGSF